MHRWTAAPAAASMDRNSPTAAMIARTSRPALRDPQRKTRSPTPSRVMRRRGVGAAKSAASAYMVVELMGSAHPGQEHDEHDEHRQQGQQHIEVQELVQP